MNAGPQHPIEKAFNRITPYHLYLFALLFTSKAPMFWHIVSLIFLGPKMNYYCNSTSTKPAEIEATKNQCPCDDPWWDRSVFTETVQTKYGLLCDTAKLLGLSNSGMYCGCLVGALSFGLLSDKYGRLSMFSLSFLMIAVFGCLVVPMPTFLLFAIMRFLEGVGVGGAIVTGYVLCVEYCGVTQREWISALFHVPLNIGHMTLSLLSYIFRDMNHFQLVISIPVIAFVPMYLCCYESPKWLVDNNRIDRAVTVMEKIAKFNKTTVGTVRAEIEAHSKTAKTNQHIKFWHIFRYKRLVRNFLCMAVNYLSCGMGYYGVSQYISHMSGNIHVNVAISGAVVAVGTLCCTYCVTKFPRRSFLMTSSFISGVMMLIVTYMPEDFVWTRIVLACICNNFFFTSFIIVFLYGVELFPTSVRNSVLGILSVTSRVGQMVAPLVNQFSQTLSGTLFGVLAIVAAVLCIPLPETKNKPLPSTLEEA